MSFLEQKGSKLDTLDQWVLAWVLGGTQDPLKILNTHCTHEGVTRFLIMLAKNNKNEKKKS